MSALLHTAMSAARQTQRALDITANNMANTQTPGFRADLSVAQSVRIEGSGYDSVHHAVLGNNVIDTTPAMLHKTGRVLDVAIQGVGFFVVERAEGGVGYTRSGSFSVDAEGTLSNHGRPVMGEGGPIVLPPHTDLSIGADGSVSVRTSGEKAPQVVDRLLLVNPPPSDLMKGTEGLLLSRSGQEHAHDENVVVVPEHLESSNASAVDSMMQAMSLNRAFDMQMRLYKVTDEMTDAGNRLLRT